MKNETLKNRIHKYICKKKDIFCEKDIDREIVINKIFEKYKQIAENFHEKELYLDYINNDILTFIGYFIELKKNTEGSKLWIDLDKRMYKDNNPTTKILDENNIKLLLYELPLYYVLSFLGYACYKTN
jgi:hypothetical protein